VFFLIGGGTNVCLPCNARCHLVRDVASGAVTVCLDLPGPSRRIRVEPLRLPAPARREEPARESAPPEREVERDAPATPDREPVPA
jgi:hypothetical protein